MNYIVNAIIELLFLWNFKFIFVSNCMDQLHYFKIFEIIIKIN